RHDLAELVISLGINLHALRAEDIPELHSSPNLQAFQQLIRKTAQAIPRFGHAEDYKDALRTKAEEIVNAWHNTQTDLGESLKKIFFVGLISAGAEAAHQLTGLERNITNLLVEAGIGIYVYRGMQAIDQPSNAPYQYLTQVPQAENPFVRGTFPLGIA